MSATPKLSEKVATVALLVGQLRKAWDAKEVFSKIFTGDLHDETGFQKTNWAALHSGVWTLIHLLSEEMNEPIDRMDLSPWEIYHLIRSAEKFSTIFENKQRLSFRNLLKLAWSK